MDVNELGGVGRGGGNDTTFAFRLGSTFQVTSHTPIRGGGNELRSHGRLPTVILTTYHSVDSSVYTASSSITKATLSRFSTMKSRT